MKIQRSKFFNFNLAFIILVTFLNQSCKSQNGTHKTCDHFENEWQKIKDTMGKFEIIIPNCDIQKSKQSQIIDNVSSDIHVTSVNLQNQDHLNLAYSISFQKFEFQDAKSVFKAQIDYIKSGTNFDLQYEAVLDTLDIKVRELYFTSSQANLILINKLFLRNETFYKILVIVEKDKSHNKSIKKFIDSFKFFDY